MATNELVRGWTGGAVVRIALACSFLVSCGAPPLTARGASVQLMKGDPPTNCTEVGPVDAGAGDFVGGDQGAKNGLKNSAAEQGANYVRLEQVGAHYTGTAYKCP